ncbi:hypothetical protein KZ813_16645 [Sphingomonas sp. RHCKR7]|uniref:DUF6894 family protein n=1 Tax=Sphingomonas folli TaxID=2862497 RepID=UPI001CA566AF|nr:hypothetical protein [Sphingomonas folli]MBW6528474.1 hypothetical protein [Sphingomonas folli]
MPRFFFDVHNGTARRDREGVELASVDAVRSFAARLAAQLLQEDPAAYWNGDMWHISVTDDMNLTLFRLTFVAVDAPFLGSSSGDEHAERT